MFRTARHAFTLVELLVVIAIVGVLVALLLPAVQAAREAARRTHCKNNIRQLALACLVHEEQLGHLPSSGWGFRWAGEPDRGFGQTQPGGWAYNALPFLEQSATRDMSKGLSELSRREQGAKMQGTPLEEFICPSRRQAIAYEKKHPNWSSDQLSSFNTGSQEFTARSDYAINSGTIYPQSQQGPPRPYDWTWPGWDTGPSNPESAVSHTYIHADSNGVSYQRSEVKFGQIVGGASKTYLIGEKYLGTDFYENGICNGDFVSLYNGQNVSVNRWAGRNSLPQRDAPGPEFAAIFGGPHEASLLMSFCDGSVQDVAYDVAPEIHEAYGDRN
jgi:prepilin-type N-terminal cleavage/methylation domain-containing protein